MICNVKTGGKEFENVGATCYVKAVKEWLCEAQVNRSVKAAKQGFYKVRATWDARTAEAGFFKV